MVLLGAVAHAEDKSRYNLFERTPKELRRDMSTDRPDLTESPHTVDAGWFQVEADVVSYLEDGDAAERLKSVALALTNFKFGITHDMDLQFIWSPYVRQRTLDRATGATTTVDGVSNLFVRLKWNLWGNDGGKTAFAVMPFVVVPTASSGLETRRVQGGVIAPFGMDLGNGYGFGAQLEISRLRNPADTGHETVFSGTAVLGKDFTDRLGGYVELFLFVPTESDAFATFDFGVTYALTGDLQLDAAAIVGLNDAAPDIIVFVGVSWRF